MVDLTISIDFESQTENTIRENEFSRLSRRRRRFGSIIREKILRHLHLPPSVGPLIFPEFGRRGCYFQGTGLIGMRREK